MSKKATNQHEQIVDVILSVSITEKQNKKLQSYATKTDRSKSHVIRMLIDKSL